MDSLRTGGSSDQAVTVHRTCPLCEATCGLTLTVDRGAVTAVRGDADDVFSAGYICPKGVALGELHGDPDRLRRPLIRRGASWSEVSWDEAFAEVDRLLTPVLAQHGRDAVGVYLGNPTVHNHAATLYAPALLRALGTGYRFSASTVDQMPKQVASALMFGSDLSVLVPDVDRTNYLLVLGANPLVSNGSLLTAPDLPGRLRALRRRGGRLVVVDPRRTRTAEAADEHIWIRPGTDALLLAAIAHVLYAERLVDPGAAGSHLRPGDLEALGAALTRFDPDTVAPACQVPASTIRRLAREIAAADGAVVYGRIGTTTTEFGTAASWLVDVITTLTGNLDSPGGALWPLPAAGSPNTRGEPGRGRGARIPGSRRTRVRGAASVFGEFPAATLAEEIDTPGDGRLRGLVTLAGNPVLSTPNSGRLGAALATLDVMVSVDAYLNETTRFANVILPAASPLARSHFDIVFASFAVRNVANYSPPSLAHEPDGRDEADILLRLASIAVGGGLTEDQLDDVVAAELARQLSADASSPAAGCSAEEMLVAVSSRRRQDRLLDMLLRAGPYGDGFGRVPGGLSLAVLEEHPHGIDLGPLKPRLPEVLRTPSGQIELAHPLLVAELDRLAASLGRPTGGFVLVGRRQLRSNNSWMHNLPLLAGGSNRCTLHIHPDDAERLGITTEAIVRSRVGELQVPVEVTDAMMPGVVSLPHGWGHAQPGVQLGVAASRPGANSNELTDEVPLDPLSGTAVLTAIPVEVSAAQIGARSPGAQRERLPVADSAS